MPRHLPTPRVLLSRCLLEPCLPEGSRVENAWIERLVPHVEVVSICPRLESDLEEPLVPCSSRKRVDEGLPVESGGERDAPRSRRSREEARLRALEPVDGIVLARSSSRSSDAPDESADVEPGAAALESRLTEQFGAWAIERERRLRDPDVRRHVATRLFTLADLRDAGNRPTMARLVDLHRRHKYLLLAYDEARYRRMGPLVANAEGRAPPDIFERYAKLFRAAFREPPSRGAYLNAFEHAYGHLRESLSPSEKESFRRSSEALEHGRLAPDALGRRLLEWARRASDDYLLDQSLLSPAPDELLVSNE